MSTLKTGMEMGFVSIQDILKQLGVSIEDKTKYDLGPNGQVTISSLVQGMQNGQFNIDQALEVIRQMVVQKQMLIQRSKAQIYLKQQPMVFVKMAVNLFKQLAKLSKV